MRPQQAIKIASKLALVASTEAEAKVYTDLVARISARIESKDSHTKQFTYLIIYIAIMLFVVVVF